MVYRSLKIASALVAGALSLLQSGCSREDAVPSAPPSRPDVARGDESRPEGEQPRDHSGGLIRLRTAVAGLPVNPMVTRGDLLEEARVWVSRNSPDLTERERELQSQLIVIVGGLLDEESASVARMIGMAEFPLFGLVVRDADGDGVLTEQEAASSVDKLPALQDAVWDFYPESADADGDGTITDSERAAAFDGLNDGMMSMMDAMIERAMLATWDIDRDGLLSERERAAGLASVPDEAVEGDVWQRTDALRDVVQPLRDAMLLVPAADRVQVRDAVGPTPLSPRRDEFDLDGDGVLTGIEDEAFRRAAEDHVAARDAYLRRANTAPVLADWAVAAARLDEDGDGTVDSTEWEQGFESLRRERDRRVFTFLYDLDSDGVLSDREITVFVDRYEGGEPYADADLDGRVGPDDLRYFLDMVTGQ